MGAEVEAARENRELEGDAGSGGGEAVRSCECFVFVVVFHIREEKHATCLEGPLQTVYRRLLPQKGKESTPKAPCDEGRQTLATSG